MSGTIQFRDLERALANINTASNYSGVVGTGSTTTQVVDSVGGWDTNMWAQYGVQFSQTTVTPALRGVWQQISSNTGNTLTLAAALPAAPVAGDTYNIRPFGSQVQDLTAWAGQAVAAPQGDADGVAALASGLPVFIAHLVGWTGAAWNRLKLGLSGGLVIQKPSALQNYVPAGTSAAASTPLLVNYGSTKAHFTPPDAGTMRVAFALSASVTVSMTRDATATTPTYDALNSGAAVPAASELAFDIPVDPNDAIDFEISAAATVNVFKVYFIYGG